jgi:hypothetical protein
MEWVNAWYNISSKLPDYAQIFGVKKINVVISMDFRGTDGNLIPATSTIQF